MKKVTPATAARYLRRHVYYERANGDLELVVRIERRKGGPGWWLTRKDGHRWLVDRDQRLVALTAPEERKIRRG